MRNAGREEDEESPCKLREAISRPLPNPPTALLSLLPSQVSRLLVLLSTELLGDKTNNTQILIATNISHQKHLSFNKANLRLLP